MESRERETHESPEKNDELSDLRRQVDALEQAVRQLTEEVRRLYESEDFR